MQIQGYIIVMKPEVLIELYDVPEWADSDVIIDLRKNFAAFDPKRYRGIFRWCLFAYPSLNAKEIKDFQDKCGILNSPQAVPLGKKDARARYRFREIIGNPVDEFSPLSGKAYDVLDSLADAKELYFLLDDPRRWEIIHVSREESYPTEDALGYDIGLWDHNHFSLIGDTIVTPSFHGPPPREDYFEVACAMSKLNEHLLFTSITDADAFRTYYRSKSWGEKESIGFEFDIIRVDAVSLKGCE